MTKTEHDYILQADRRFIESVISTALPLPAYLHITYEESGDRYVCAEMDLDEQKTPGVWLGEVTAQELGTTVVRPVVFVVFHIDNVICQSIGDLVYNALTGMQRICIENTWGSWYPFSKDFASEEQVQAVGDMVTALTSRVTALEKVYGIYLGFNSSTQEYYPDETTEIDSLFVAGMYKVYAQTPSGKTIYTGFLHLSQEREDTLYQTLVWFTPHLVVWEREGDVSGYSAWQKLVDLTPQQ